MVSEVNFNIVEGYSHDHKFNDFSRDYKRNMPKKDLMKKYDIPPSIWKEWRDKLPPRKFSRGGNTKKRVKKQKRHIHGFRLIRKIGGNVTVNRIKNSGYWSYGTYPDRTTAEMVKDKLLESDWDRDIAYDLIEEYAVRNSKYCLLSRIREREW